MIIYIVYILISPILWGLVYITALFNIKIEERVVNYSKIFKDSLKKTKLSEKEIIIFHAASNGELEQLKPLFRNIDRNKYFIFLTISSSSINDIPNEEVDTFCYQPFDFPWLVLYFFYKIKPAKYIITRHDIWPNHIMISNVLSIETYLINANLPENSKRMSPLLRSLYKFIFNRIDYIYTVSEENKIRLEKLIQSENSINVFPDTRFSQIIFRHNSLKNKLMPKSILATKNILFGSIENRDINIIFKSLSSINNILNKNKSKLIFVPHEPSEDIIKKIENNLDQLNISSARYSNLNEIGNNNAIIVDSVGILADLYKFSSIAYIGCGFGKGVHNVIEPAVYGNVVCFGPNYHILSEAIEMIENNIAHVINNSDDLKEILLMIDKNLDQKSSEAKDYVFSKSNLSQTVISKIFC